MSRKFLDPADQVFVLELVVGAVAQCGHRGPVEHAVVGKAVTELGASNGKVVHLPQRMHLTT